jgi:macrolide transport system ATP-binding/permease protein
MSGPLLRLEGVGRVFEADSDTPLHALAGIDLAIYEGEFVAIVGPSGGGKTTLLSILGLLDSPTSGEYFVDGVPTSSVSEAKRTLLRATMFGFVFQAFHLLDRRPISDSAELALFYQGVGASERAERASTALSSLGLTGRENDLASKLSGGQRQRVAISRAVASGNPVILADEPTGNLDSETGAAVLAEFQNIHRSGGTVVVVTHSDEVAATADRIVRISDGRIVSDNGPQQPGMASGGAALARLAPRRVRRRDMLREAMRSVLSRGGQSLGLVLAVAVAAALMIVSLGLGASASTQVSETFDARANREVAVTWDRPSAKPVADAVRDAADLAGVVAVAGVVDHGEVEVATRAGAFKVTLRGAVGDIPGATSSRITWANSHDTVSRDEVIVGRALARQLELAPLALTPVISVGGQNYVVVGIVEASDRFPLLSGELVMGEEQALEEAPPAGSQLAIVTASGAASQVGRYAAIAIDAMHPEWYSVSVPVDPQTLRQEVEGGVQVTLVAFTVLAGLVAILTLGNAITSSVMARRGELGLRRAVGARGRDLGLLVSLEAALVGLCGGLVGLFIGVIALLVFTISQRWLPVFDLALAPVAVLAGLLLATLSSVLGAARAARVSPLTALRG